MLASWLWPWLHHYADPEAFVDYRINDNAVHK